jgi:hypothetical protein
MINNTKEIFYAIYCLMNLVTLEADDQDVRIDIIHFCFEIQVNCFCFLLKIIENLFIFFLL